MQFVTPSPTQRASLRRFEDAFGRWSAASAALAAAELRLWAETLRDPQGKALRTLADEVLRLRAVAEQARHAMPDQRDGAGVARTH